jgi:hypothetical protein
MENKSSRRSRQSSQLSSHPDGNPGKNKSRNQPCVRFDWQEDQNPLGGPVCEATVTKK